MENIYNDIDELIGKYLAGEASEAEALEVQQWAKQTDANQRYFHQLQTIFDRASRVKSNEKFDADTAWQKVRSKLKNGTGAKVVSLDPVRTSFATYWRVAAAVLVLVVAGIFVVNYYRSTQPEIVEVIADVKPKSDTLPDGSNVFLNKQSQLVFVHDKRSKKRKVQLKGEAYFDIRHQEEEEFVIDIEGVYIRDIGTSFNVKAYPQSNTIEVVVESGEVMFYTDRDSGVYLKANGKGVYDKITKKFNVELPEANVTSYKSKFFIFSGTSLAQVVQDLNAVYEKKFTVPEHLKRCKLTVNFNNETPDEIANVIAETLNLKVKQTQSGYEFEGNSCEE